MNPLLKLYFKIFITEYGKRIMYISSLYVYLKDIKIVNDNVEIKDKNKYQHISDLVMEINNICDVVDKNDKAIRLGVAYSDSIWSKTGIKTMSELKNEYGKDDVIYYYVIANHIPNWLKYQDDLQLDDTDAILTSLLEARGVFSGGK